MSKRAILPLALCAALLAACDDDPPADYPQNPPSDPAAAQPPVAVAADANADGYADTDPSALTDFHTALDPNGVWVDDPNYGTVWVPNAEIVGGDFAPYVSAGHWTYDDDYVWASDYDWGWAPFHYGRWVYVAGTGWAWIPGRTYAGAWVEWRDGGDGYPYVGWAPLPPIWVWRGGVAVGIGVVPPAAYVFCGHGDIFARGIRGRIIVGDRVGEIAGHTTAYAGAGGAVGGHSLATPSVNHGPPPSRLGIADSAVPHSTGIAGVAHAQAFAHVSTATAAGGHAPAAHTYRPAPQPQHVSTATHYSPASAPHYGGHAVGGHHR